MTSLQGQLLIASPRLLDPNFVRSVILMVQHDENGSIGLVVNRPLEVSVREVTEQAIGESLDVDGTLHGGGPCEGPLMAVHDDPTRSQITVGDGIHFTADREDVESLLRQPDASVKFFVGYAGWGAGQLEEELEIGSWLQTRAEPRQVLSPVVRQWQKWVTILTGELRLPPERLPDDPSVN